MDGMEGGRAGGREGAARATGISRGSARRRLYCGFSLLTPDWMNPYTAAVPDLRAPTRPSTAKARGLAACKTLARKLLALKLQAEQRALLCSKHPLRRAIVRTRARYT